MVLRVRARRRGVRLHGRRPYANELVVRDRDGTLIGLADRPGSPAAVNCHCLAQHAQGERTDVDAAYLGRHLRGDRNGRVVQNIDVTDVHVYEAVLIDRLGTRKRGADDDDGQRGERDRHVPSHAKKQCNSPLDSR